MVQYSTKLYTLFEFYQFSTNVLFVFQNLTFIYCLSLVLRILQLKKFFFHDLDISEKYRSLSYGISLNLVCFFLFGMRVCMPLGGKNTKEISYVLLVHQIKRFIMSKCLITGDADFHHLVKVVSARFLRCKVTIFLFYLISRRRYFETTHILFLFKLSPTNFTTNW